MLSRSHSNACTPEVLIIESLLASRILISSRTGQSNYSELRSFPTFKSRRTFPFFDVELNNYNQFEVLYKKIFAQKHENYKFNYCLIFQLIYQLSLLYILLQNIPSNIFP